MKEKIIKSLSQLLLVALIISLGSCNKDSVDDSPNVYPTSVDLLDGVLVHRVNIDDLGKSWIQICSDKEIVVESKDNRITFNEAIKDGKRYLKPQVSGIGEDEFAIIPIRVHLKNNESVSRRIILIVNSTSSMESSGNDDQESDPGLTAPYSDGLGKGTRCYAQFPNSTKRILFYDKIKKAGERYLTINTTLNENTMMELCGESYESISKDWSFDVGLSFNQTANKGTLFGGNSQRRYSGSIDLGMSGSSFNSEAYEYYLNFYKVKKAELRLDLSNFEPDGNRIKGDSTILNWINSDFLTKLGNSDFNTTTFYDNWGTDIINQGTYGGYMIYYYGRKENVYENSLGIDASASLKVATVDENNKMEKLIDIYKAKNSNYLNPEVSVDYDQTSYEKASKSISGSYSKGGNSSINDAGKWIEGFNDGVTDKWSLISFRTSGDNISDSTMMCYGVDQLGVDLYTVISEQCGDTTELSTADKKLLLTLKTNVAKLIDDKKSYVDSKTIKQTAKGRLVVADIMMLSKSGGNVNDRVKMFFGTDKNNSTTLMYRPLRANKYIPDKDYLNKALDTNTAQFLTTTHDGGHYWFYAMANENDCNGIVDVIFCPEDSYDYYYMRGDNARTGTGGSLITKNGVCVKWYDSGKNKPEDKITAIGLCDYGAKKYFATTPGAELPYTPTESEDIAFKDFWEKSTFSEDSHSFYEQGGIIKSHYFRPNFSRATLPIKRLTDTNVFAPLK